MTMNMAATVTTIAVMVATTTTTMVVTMTIAIITKALTGKITMLLVRMHQTMMIALSTMMGEDRSK